MKNTTTFAFALLVALGVLFAGPTANAGSPQSVNVGSSVSFDASGSTCSGCTIASYNWNFDDGNSATGVSTSHTYSSSGTYSATLAVVDTSGNIDVNSVTITVSSADTTPPTITHTPVTTGSNSSAISITATITDNVAVQAVTLYYKNSALANNTSTWSSSTMSATGDTYSGEIPLTSLNTSGAMYYISAVDTSSNTKKSPENASQSNGSSVYAIAVSSTDTSPPSTFLISVTNLTVSPYWLTNNSSNNVVIRVSGESGMSCRVGSYATNYTNQLSYGGTDCTVSSSTASCVQTFSTDSTLNYYVGCKDGTGNVQPLASMVNVSVGLDQVAPTSIANITAYNPGGYVYLVWSASTDATSGLSGQRIYRSSDSGSTWTLASTTTGSAVTWVDTSPLSSNNYLYKVIPFDTAGWNATSAATASVTVALTSGWNFVGITQNLTNTSIASVLSGLNLSNVEKILYWNGSSWKTCVVSAGALVGGCPGLATMDAGRGYWIKTTAAQNFNTRGAQAASVTFSLVAGWNAVSFPRLYNPTRNASSVFSSIAGNYTSIMKFNSTTQSYQVYAPGYGGELSISGGEGFWIYMTSPGTVTVN